MTPVSLKRPAWGGLMVPQHSELRAAAGRCPSPEKHGPGLPRCAGAVVLVPGRCVGVGVLSSASISFRGQREGKSSAWFGQPRAPVLLGREQKGAEHPETSSCPAGHAAPHTSVRI